MDQHPFFPIAVGSGKLGKCKVKRKKEGKGLPDGIRLPPDFTFHRCKEHFVWVFWR